MRFARPLCAGLIAALLAASAHPEDADDPLRVYAVHIERTPKQEGWTGNGVYLGNGVALTAAHVAGLGLWTSPRVEIAGEALPTEVLKDGHFHDVDLTLLSVDQSRLPVRVGLRRLPLCQNAPWVGEPVVVITPERLVRSEVMSPYLLPPGIPERYQSVVRYVPGIGASGSGILDASRKCLLGIIVRKVSRTQTYYESGQMVTMPRDIAMVFVPASTIADFIPSEVRF
ncbi:MAG TPA: serine protease [Xanthobacteraceae bacterium]